ncbi:hypothetical protein WR25_11461 [Diploscapter pachys]|uniref:Chloride channel protein n=1 Tax=Diploscapter pachys TaxID=2018661 RepID=A0A2A2J619_9BILA|nr:hypothetical protein WR25_11461 [Diploscapter pachys]
MKRIFRGFFAACCGAITIRLLKGYVAETEVTVNAFYQTSFGPTAFGVPELPLFALLGILCGLIGSLYISFYRNLVLFLRNNSIAKRLFQQHWLVYPLVVSSIFAIMAYPHGIVAQFCRGRIKFGANLRDFFANCTFSAPANSPFALSTSVMIFEITGQLHFILPVIIGPKARKLEAERRVKNAIQMIDAHFRNAEDAMNERKKRISSDSNLIGLEKRKTSKREGDFRHNELEMENNKRKKGLRIQKTLKRLILNTVIQSTENIERFTLYLVNINHLLGREEWEREKLKEEFELTDEDIDPAPFSLVKKTSLYRIHSIFSMMQLNIAFVTECGRLIGCVGLADVRRALDESKTRKKQDIREVEGPSELNAEQEIIIQKPSINVIDILTLMPEVIKPGKNEEIGLTTEKDAEEGGNEMIDTSRSKSMKEFTRDSVKNNRIQMLKWSSIEKLDLQLIIYCSKSMCATVSAEYCNYNELGHYQKEICDSVDRPKRDTFCWTRGHKAKCISRSSQTKTELLTIVYTRQSDEGLETS